MKPEQVSKLFNAEIKKRGIASKVPTLSKFKIYDMRQGRCKISLGDQLEVLYYLGKIKITPTHESHTSSQTKS